MSVTHAKKRVNLFMTAAAAKAKKPAAKQPPKVKAKKPGEFHDKLDAKLEKLAKKHGVSITLRRNKSKLPTIVVGRIKNKKYGDVVKIFSEISNTSPVPQKMKENGASFRVFGPRNIAASDDHDFVVKANKNGKTVYMTAEGWTDSKADADVYNEESADKIVRRLNAKGESSTTSGYDVERIGSNLSADDGETADNYEGTEDSETEDSEEYEDDDDSEGGDEDEEVANLIAMISDNSISRDAVNKVFDRALAVYADDLKNNGPVDDAVGFIYDTLGPEDALTAIRTLVNQATLNKESGGV